MSVRNTHNRQKDFIMDKDINVVRKKAKVRYSGWGSFVIEKINDTYCADMSVIGFKANIVEKWQNIATHDKRAKWEQIQ